MDTLPPELFSDILQLGALLSSTDCYSSYPADRFETTVQLAKFARVSKAWQEIAQRLLYQNPTLMCRDGLTMVFCTTLSQNPGLAAHIRSLEVDVEPESRLGGWTQGDYKETSLLKILETCPNIEELKIHKCSAPTGLFDILLAAPSLRHLCISTGGLSFSTDRSRNLTFKLECLQLLRTRIEGSELDVLSVSLPHLKHLAYIRCSSPQDSPLLSFLHSVRNLDLDLDLDAGHLPDRWTRHLSDHFSALDNLRLTASDCSPMEGKSVLHSFATTSIKSLTVLGTSGDMIEELLESEEMLALRDLKSVAVEVYSFTWGREQTTTFKELENLEVICWETGVVFDGCFQYSSEQFWRRVAPEINHFKLLQRL